mgnify:CR=1 FL=1
MNNNLENQKYVKEINQELKIYNSLDIKKLNNINFIFFNKLNDKTLSIDHRVKIYIAPYLDMKYRKDDKRCRVKC